VKARPFKLSGPALEVLSIVAYKQPCTKAQIDEIRGVESGHLLRAWMEKHLLNFGERSELPGKPMFYETTRKFLEIFGLRNIAELPSLHEIDQLIPEGIGDDEPKKEKLSDLTGELSTQMTDASYSVGEDELLKITDELTQITTSSDFFEQEKQRMREKRDADRAQDIRERQIVGEEIDSKDLRWLERYEAAKVEGAAQAEDVEFVTEGMESQNIPTSTDEAPVEQADAELSVESEEISEESSEMIADAHEESEPTEREPEQEA
jgi:segregation and condensation protein B